MNRSRIVEISRRRDDAALGLRGESGTGGGVARRILADRDHMGALGREFGSAGLADAAAGAGDDRDAT